ncbi:MAG: chloride channel protein [Desulfuromonadaceae bacterium]|nr:chloride channel protein [Desulfuromonadaceae bacterium]
MKKHITEQVTLFASVVKWTLYASIVGALVGLGTSGFLRLLALASRQATAYPYYFYFLPLTMLVSAALVRWLAPDAAGHGTEKVIEAVHKRMGRIPFAVVPVKLVATVITLAGGGSAGKEGPCAQIGAGLASAFADLLKVSDEDRRKLVICGIGAGFATVFGTPIAGALFGVEVLVLGQMLYEVLFPSFVAGIVGYHVAIALGVQYPHQTASLLPKLTGWSFLEVVALGLCCGLVALLFIEVMKVVHKLFERLQWHWSFKALLGGLLLTAIGGFVSQSYLGLGLESMETALKGGAVPASAAFWKIVASSITLSCGGSGGVVTPIFFIGTSVGNLFAQLFNEQYIAAFSAIGMVALLAGAANTPIAASVMAMELFGPQIAPFAAIACMVSFLIVGYRSIYPSQLLGIQKSASFHVPTGSAISEMGEVTASLRKKPFMGLIIKVRRRYRKRR